MKNLVITVCSSRWSDIKKISLWYSNDMNHIILMSEYTFKSHNIDTFQSLNNDVINICNRKLQLNTICKESVTINDFKSASLIKEICNSVDSTGLTAFVTNYMFALTPYLINSFYIFDPYNISCFIQEDLPFVFKFKGVYDVRYFSLLHYINITRQIELVKIVVNVPDKSSITNQYLNSKKRQKRKIYQLLILHLQPAGGKITRF